MFKIYNDYTLNQPKKAKIYRFFVYNEQKKRYPLPYFRQAILLFWSYLQIGLSFLLVFTSTKSKVGYDINN